MTEPSYLDDPFHFDPRGRSAATDPDDHVRDLIFQVLFANPALNGIDYAEYREDRNAAPPRFWIVVVFIHNAPAALLGNPGAFRIEGGTRIPSVRPTAVKAGPDALSLEVTVEAPGDFSVY